MAMGILISIARPGGVTSRLMARPPTRCAADEKGHPKGGCYPGDQSAKELADCRFRLLRIVEIRPVPTIGKRQVRCQCSRQKRDNVALILDGARGVLLSPENQDGTADVQSDARKSKDLSAPSRSSTPLRQKSTRTSGVKIPDRLGSP
jgi:hypothetical protein